MYNRIFFFSNSFDLLYKYQFGFREKHRTNMALFVSLDETLKALDERKNVLEVFFDLSKAFDTVHHSILLNLFTTIHDGNFRRHSLMNVTMK